MNSRVSATLIGLALAFVATTSCTRKHSFPETALEQIARKQAIGSDRLKGIQIYLDGSGSMRGFALTATANRPRSGDAFQSLLIALDSLRDVLPPDSASGITRDDIGRGKPNDRIQQDANGAQENVAIASVDQHVQSYLFGSQIEPLPNNTLLLSPSMGRSLLPGLRDKLLDASWSSRDCDERWGGSPEVRQSIDKLYSQETTCLSGVFERILRERGEGVLHLIVTDAEQTGFDDSVICPSPKNLANIQAAIHTWVHDHRGYAALAMFRLPSFPWKASAVGETFCGCRNRNLFVYILAPSGEAAEAVYTHLAKHWRGGDDMMAYLPLAARSASQYEIQMAVDKPEGRRGGSLVPPRQPSHLLRPGKGVLPIFWVDLDGAEEATVHFTVRDVVFEGPEFLGVRGIVRVEWNAAEFTWPEQPTTLKPIVDAPNATPSRALAGENGLLEVIRPVGAAQAVPSGSIKRVGLYHARSFMLPSGSGVKDFPELTYILRRTRAEFHGCEAYLVQLDSAAPDFTSQAWVSIPLLRDSRPPCTDLGSLREQVRYVSLRAPALRFILHVDY